MVYQKTLEKTLKRHFRGFFVFIPFGHNAPKYPHFTRSVKTFPNVKDCWVKKFSEGSAVLNLDLKKGTLDDVAKMLQLNDNWQFKVVNIGKYDMQVDVTTTPTPKK